MGKIWNKLMALSITTSASDIPTTRMIVPTFIKLLWRRKVNASPWYFFDQYSFDHAHGNSKNLERSFSILRINS